MRLVCPSCRSKYEVDEALFPEEGREVQCSNCEEVWVQYPVEEQEPIRLDPLTRVDDDDEAAIHASPPRPSEHLGDDERDALAEAVNEEITALGGVTRDEAVAAPPRQRAPAQEEASEDDDDILASLRAQIALEGGEFGKGGQAKAQKRNLRVAAEAVGVDVEDKAEEDASRHRKWNLDEDTGRTPDPAPGPQQRSDGLARALRGYEDEVVAPPRRRGMRRGFLLGLLVVLIAGTVYTMRTELGAAYPPAQTYLDRYAAVVDDARRGVEELYTEYGPPVVERIRSLIGGEDSQ